MNKIGWTHVVVFVAVALVVCVVGAGLLAALAGVSGRIGVMGRGGMGMMGRGGPLAGVSFPCLSLFVVLIPITLLPVLIFGGLWFVRNRGGTASAPRPTCPRCGRDVRTDWRVCPHCGQSLGKEEGS